MRLPVCESGLVTVIVTVPAACAGVTQVMLVGLVTVGLVQSLVSSFTVAPFCKSAPVRVMSVPPAVVPEVGDTEASVGAGGGAT